MLHAILAAVTAQELRRAAAGYSATTVRAAVEGGLAECPLPDIRVEPDFPNLVIFWLLDPDAWEWFPPPLMDETIAAIHRRLVAAAN